ncbi:MAG: hypothetical protein ABF636_12275, partial [Acetobacter sp.]
PGECRIILNNQKICLVHTRMPFKNLPLGYDAQMTKNNHPPLQTLYQRVFYAQNTRKNRRSRGKKCFMNLL